MTRKHPHKNHGRVRTNFKHPQRSRVRYKVKRFLGQHFVSLLALVVTVLTSFTIYFLAYSEPDIRFLKSDNILDMTQAIKTKDGNCLYHATAKQMFKNLSMKSGYIGDVKIVPLNLEMLSECKLIDIDKSKILWGEQKEIETKFDLIMDSSTCKEWGHAEELYLQIKYFDNTGKLLDRNIDGEETGLDSGWIVHLRPPSGN